jgi:hypothetical protein
MTEASRDAEVLADQLGEISLSLDMIGKQFGNFTESNEGTNEVINIVLSRMVDATKELAAANRSISEGLFSIADAIRDS